MGPSTLAAPVILQPDELDVPERHVLQPGSHDEPDAAGKLGEEPGGSVSQDLELAVGVYKGA